MKKEDPTQSAAERPAFPRGAEWLRADFHLHSRADTGPSRKPLRDAHARDAGKYLADYVQKLSEAGVRLGVVTNHNVFDKEDFKWHRKAMRELGGELLPGIELKIPSGAGIEVIVVFHPEWFENIEENKIDRLVKGIHPGYPGESNPTTCDFADLIQRLDDFKTKDRQPYDYFLIFPHVESGGGLLNVLTGDSLGHFITQHKAIFETHVLGLQRVKDVKRLRARWPAGVRIPALVEGSDPHSIEEVASGPACYLKLGELSFDAVKFALFDHEHRCRSALPEQQDTVRIRGIRFEGAKLDGKEIEFSNALNCLIGPRGNGKSAIIECCRHALGFDLEGRADADYKADLVNSFLTPGGKVVLEAVDEFGRSIRIERERSGAPSVFVDGQYREIKPAAVLKDILYFGQKDLSARSESFDEHFLDRLLADRLPPREQEEQRLMEQVRQAASQLKEALDAADKLEGYRKEMNELEVQLQVYGDKGVDAKLQNMTVFDADRQAIQSWQQQVRNLRQSLAAYDGEWAEIVSEFPPMRSALMAPLAPDLDKLRAAISDAARDAKSATDKLSAAISDVSNLLQKLEPTQKQLKEDLAELQRSLNEPGLDLELFRNKTSRLDQLKKLLAAGAQRGKTEQVARDSLGAAAQALHEFRRQLFQEREKEIRALEQELPPDIRIQTAFKGKAGAFEEFLRGTMRGSGVQSTSYETVAGSFKDGWELYKDRAKLDALVSEAAAAKLKAALADHLSDFILFRVPDKTEIVYQGIPLGKYSLGQRATVILHFLMHVRRHPVILIDQPEDDLDNETIYSHFVQQLLDRKAETQFIFATHNPNIPVLGDAELVIACRRQGDAFSFDHGSIDAKAIQERVITVMEGGREAFKRRKEIYQLWKSSN